MSPVRKVAVRIFSLTSVIVCGLAIAVAALLLTLILPGVVAHRGGTFYQADIEDVLPLHGAEQLELERRARAEHEARRAKLDGLIDRAIAGADLDGAVHLVELRAGLDREASGRRPAVRAIPYYLNPQMLLWPTLYTCLGWLVVLCAPRKWWAELGPGEAGRTLALGLAVYAFYQWPHYLRNFVLSDEGRVVYAYPNVDVHPASFVTQEAVVFGFCLLMAIVWRQHQRVYVDNEAQLQTMITPGFDAPLAAHLSRVFFAWVRNSVIANLGFLPFIFFYWGIVAQIGDQRYMLSAIQAHALWGVTWLMLTLPLLRTWRHWHEERLELLEKLMTRVKHPARRDSAKAQLDVLLEFQPIQRWNFVAANVGGFVSFVLPLFQLLLD